MRDFSNLLPEPQRTDFLTFVRDRMQSTHRKFHATCYIWDKNATHNGIKGGWTDLSAYGFEASIKYADVFTGSASTLTLTAVDPSQVRYNPFNGFYKYLFERGNRVKVIMEEKDLPIPNVLIPLFEGEIIDVSYRLSRATKKSEWEVQCQVKNYHRFWKKSVTIPEAFYPPHDVNFQDFAIVQPAQAGQDRFLMNAAELRANYLNGDEIWLTVPDAPPGTPADRYIILQTRPSTPGNSLGTVVIAGYLKRDYPAGTIVARPTAPTVAEADTGYIARQVLKITGYADSMGLSDRDLLRDIPNTGYIIQSKVQFHSIEISEILQKLLITGGCIPYIRPYDGRIVAINILKKIKNARSGVDSQKVDKILTTDEVISLDYSSDSSSLVNQVEVIGLSPDKTINTRAAQKIFSVNGSIGWWSNSSFTDNGPTAPGYEYRIGKQYLSWTVFASEDGKMRARNWMLNPQNTKKPENPLFWTEIALLPHNEYECELRLYYDNSVRQIMAGIGAAIAIVKLFGGLIGVVHAIQAGASKAEAVAAPIAGAAMIAGPLSAVVAGGATARAVSSGALAFQSLISSNFIVEALQGLALYTVIVSDYQIQVDANLIEERYQEISATASMSYDVLNREGNLLEKEENHLISTTAKALEVATLLLLVKRSEATRANFQQIYDYELESGDIVQLEVYRDSTVEPPEVVVQEFLVREITLNIARGEAMISRYSLSYLDPSVELADTTIMVNPEIAVEQAFGYDYNVGIGTNQLSPYGGGVPRPNELRYPHNGGLRTRDTASRSSTGGRTEPENDPYGKGSIPLVLNRDPIVKSESEFWRKSTHRHELFRVVMKNHNEIYSSIEPGIANGKKYAYIYSYSTIKTDLEDGEAKTLLNGTFYRPGDTPTDAAALIRAATPSPHIFNDIEMENLTFGLGHPRLSRYEHPNHWNQDTGDLPPNHFQYTGPHPNAIVIGTGPCFELGASVFSPVDSDGNLRLLPGLDGQGNDQPYQRLGHAEDPNLGFLSLGINLLGATAGRPGQLINDGDRHDGLKRDGVNGLPLPFSDSGVMWWEEVPDRVTDLDALIRYFYVAMPLEVDQNTHFTRVFIRVALVELIDGRPAWGTLTLSNSTQMMVYGVRK